jgi:hypothetical protein
MAERLRKQKRTEWDTSPLRPPCFVSHGDVPPSAPSYCGVAVFSGVRILSAWT